MILILQFLILGITSSEGEIIKNYKGESFPVRYLEIDTVTPTVSDVGYYLQGLGKIVERLEIEGNETNVNVALGLFYMNAILKRTIQESKHKLEEDELKTLKRIIDHGANTLSHFFWSLRSASWDNLVKRLVGVLQDDELQVQEIADYNKNRLQQWILSDNSFNDFSQVMDELKLSRDEYLKLTEDSVFQENNYTITIDNSDYCIGEVIYNPMPLDKKTFRKCVSDYCSELLYEPVQSVSYTLSHRMLNVLFARHVRLCYMKGYSEDAEFLDILCASMYRETVYIARLGYFSRDVFMEHIALCSLLGYQEFHRRHWFRKVASWIDDEGCIAENVNYEMNRTRHKLRKINDEERGEAMEKAKERYANNCHFHPMALSVIVLAHGIRHAVYFKEDGILKDEL